ncbi:MAG: hypothetical protein COA42_19155 [Alteromonadaceae bacterium]|nr:MAG: hypothetical protein COA42_19155 [Alteromonadaceae bacterium]
MLSEQLISNVIQATKLYEGEIPYMYLDSKGLVTVGVGFYLPTAENATSYQFNTRNNTPASSEQIISDYEVVAAMQANMAASYYKRNNGLIMPTEEIDAQLRSKIGVFATELAGLYSDFYYFPDSVQEALFDMVFNLGITNLRTTWPSFNAAVGEQNWQVAAEQSNRKAPVSQARNEYVKNLLLSAV